MNNPLSIGHLNSFSAHIAVAVIAIGMIFGVISRFAV